MALPAGLYFVGLYSTRSASRSAAMRALRVFAGCVLTMFVTIGASYVMPQRPLGRGVMLLGLVITFLLVLAHHLWLLRTLRAMRESASA
ncbi:MAG: hypothetical protein ABMA13_14095 [Chthoniobacteraceae bacterium]